MKRPQLPPLKVLAVVLPLGALLLWVALRTGPMAPISVTEAPVQSQPLTPQLFGLGTVQARQVHTLGPTVAGRVQTLAVDVGDSVQAGQVLGTMDPVDLDARIRALDAAQARAQASVQEAQTRQRFAAEQMQRYAELAQARATSAESLHIKRQERDVTQAALAAARQELQRTQADAAALRSQRQHLQLVAPQAAIVTARAVEPGSTVVAGQTVLELVAPSSVWIHLRLDQSAALGLAAGLPADIRLRSRGDVSLPGHVVRIEPHADSVTEELLAKVAFTEVPTPLPPLGELTEVTLQLPALPPAPSIPLAAVQRQGAQRGVWQRSSTGLRFTPVTLGRSDLAGNVQVLAGLQAGDSVIVHSTKALRSGARVQVVDHLVTSAAPAKAAP